MKKFVWTPNYSVNNEGLDEQHRILIHLMNEFYSYHQTGQTLQAKIFLQRLTAFTGKHFRDEEELMYRSGYPRFSVHKRSHQELLKILESLEKKYLQEQSYEVAGKLTSFLKVWLMRHILGSDKEYMPYLNKSLKIAG